MEDLMKVLGTKQMLLTTYYSQTYGQMERINQKIGTFLRHYVNYQQDNWIEWLAAVEFQYNDKKHIAIGHTPFKFYMTSMERRLNCANRISKTGRILDQSKKKLGRSNQSNGHGKRSNKEAF